MTSNAFKFLQKTVGDIDNRFIPGFVRRLVKAEYEGNPRDMILLAQLIYWWTPYNNANPDDSRAFRISVFKQGHMWLAKTLLEWEEETCVKSFTVRRSFERMEEKGLITTGRFLFNNQHTLHIRFNPEELDRVIRDYGEPPAVASKPSRSSREKLVPTEKSTRIHRKFGEITESGESWRKENATENKHKLRNDELALSVVTKIEDAGYVVNFQQEKNLVEYFDCVHNLPDAFESGDVDNNPIKLEQFSETRPEIDSLTESTLLREYPEHIDPSDLICSEGGTKKNRSGVRRLRATRSLRTRTSFQSNKTMTDRVVRIGEASFGRMPTSDRFRRLTKRFKGFINHPACPINDLVMLFFTAMRRNGYFPEIRSWGDFIINWDTSIFPHLFVQAATITSAPENFEEHFREEFRFFFRQLRQMFIHHPAFRMDVRSVRNPSHMHLQFMRPCPLIPEELARWSQWKPEHFRRAGEDTLRRLWTMFHLQMQALRNLRDAGNDCADLMGTHMTDGMTACPVEFFRCRANADIVPPPPPEVPEMEVAS